jgi:threonine dehydratase
MKLTFKDISNIHKKITDVVKWTETSYSNQISEKIGIDTYIKFENRQHTGAFKIRGSYSKLLSLSQKEKDVGVIVCRKSCTRIGVHCKKNEYFITYCYARRHSIY